MDWLGRQRPAPCGPLLAPRAAPRRIAAGENAERMLAVGLSGVVGLCYAARWRVPCGGRAQSP